MRDVSARVAFGGRVARQSGASVWAAAVLVACLALFLGSQTGQAAVYNVGPGQTYANIGDVPLESLAPGSGRWVSVSVGTTNPGSGSGSASIKMCSQNGRTGDCKTVSVSFGY